MNLSDGGRLSVTCGEAALKKKNGPVDSPARRKLQVDWIGS